MRGSRSIERITCKALFSALALCLSLPAVVRGQDLDASAAESESAILIERSEAELAARAMEEVIVRGQRPLRLLLQEGEDLTEDFYMRLNEVLNNDDYRITCENERRSGSNFNIRVCMTGYQRRILARMAQDQLRGMAAAQTAARALGGQGDSGIPVSAEYDIAQMLSYQAAFEDALLIAVNTDQVLNDQVVRLMALKSAVENYQTPRQQRREQRRADREADENTR